MSVAGEVVVGLVILLGLAGVVVQVLPGSLIVVGAVLVWAIVTGGATAWVVFVIGAVAVVAAAVMKYLLAGRHMKRADVPGSTLWWGGLFGVIGFFVIPVVGLFVGFVAAVFVAEVIRRRDARAAWQATVVALQATGITIVVELLGALVATAVWGVGVVLT